MLLGKSQFISRFLRFFSQSLVFDMENSSLKLNFRQIHLVHLPKPGPISKPDLGFCVNGRSAEKSIFLNSLIRCPSTVGTASTQLSASVNGHFSVRTSASTSSRQASATSNAGRPYPTGHHDMAVTASRTSLR